MSRAKKIISVIVILSLAGAGFLTWKINSDQQVASDLVLQSQQQAKEQAQLAIAQSLKTPTPASATSDSNQNSSNTLSSSNDSENASSNLTDSTTPSTQPSTGDSSPPSDPSAPSANNETLPGYYKDLMTGTYNETLQAMQNVKDTTYALKDQKISLSQYKGSIIQSQAIFANARTFVQAHPPTDPALAGPYEEFLSGIILADNSMTVVLNGIAALDISSLYSAKDLGTIAHDQVVHAFSQF